VHAGGKIEVRSRYPVRSLGDLRLVYTPGVAEICRAIQEDPSKALLYTAIPRTVGIVTDGSAILGLGNIGPLAGKPVMEGKACLFKKFADIDVFDLEVGERDVDKFCDMVAALEPTFGGINLEDVAAPACFEIEEKLRKRMRIPVFHDDQHGTAIISGAGLLNAAQLAGKKLAERLTEVNIHFRSVPLVLFKNEAAGSVLQPAVLSLRIQPQEGISLRFVAKVPGDSIQVGNVLMNMSYADAFKRPISEAYERLLLDCMRGDATLFNRRDSVDRAWELIQPVLQVWEATPGVEIYEDNSEGPASADEMIHRNGHGWRELCADAKTP
jgi:hypothetical protein